VVAVFLVSIPVALVAPGVAPYVWLAVLPLRILGARVSRRAAHE
jgi:hypothetical protein